MKREHGGRSSWLSVERQIAVDCGRPMVAPTVGEKRGERKGRTAAPATGRRKEKATENDEKQTGTETSLSLVTTGGALFCALFTAGVPIRRKTVALRSRICYNNRVFFFYIIHFSDGRAGAVRHAADASADRKNAAGGTERRTERRAARQAGPKNRTGADRRGAHRSGDRAAACGIATGGQRPSAQTGKGGKAAKRHDNSRASHQTLRELLRAE